MTTLIVASGNAGKIREIAGLLECLDVEVAAQSDFGVQDADETGTRFEENAIIKARHAADATGLPAIADDSGLVVDALNGCPGVYSARYAGAGASDDQNIDKLLSKLDGVDDRSAAFHCVACFVTPDWPDAIVTNGVWRGEILCERRGEGGFGYDPVFLDTETGRAAAELTAAEKNARSHRGQALRALAAAIRARGLPLQDSLNPSI